MIQGTTNPVGIFPVVGFRWGAITGTTAGELLRVRYSAGTITAAELELSDGRILELAIADGELSVLLPADTTDGVAALTAQLEDGTTQTLEILLHGLAVVPPQPGPPQGPIRRRRIDTIVSPARVVLHSGTRIQTSATRPAIVTLRSRTYPARSPAPPSSRVVAGARLELVSATRVAASGLSASGVELAASSTVHRRGVEEALLALGVL